MDGLLKIGYMGAPYSNTEKTAMIFSEKFDHTELVPLMTAKNVINALLSGTIDYGVLAMENSCAGIVTESADAVKDPDIIEEDTVWAPIHHCVFKRNEKEHVTRLVSHEQALRQSMNHIRALYPNAILERCENTAYAAELLSTGRFPPGTAVLCRREAGEHFGLFLDKENVEDREDNRTRFSLIRKNNDRRAMDLS